MRKNGRPKREFPLWTSLGLGRSEREDSFSGSPQHPWIGKEGKLFGRGSGILKSENSLGTSGFLEKRKTNRKVGFFMQGFSLCLIQAGVTHSGSFGSMSYKVRNPDSFSVSPK